MLKKLKKKYAQEEEAFRAVKKIYPNLSKMSDSGILAYLECNSRSELLRLVEDLKRVDIEDPAIVSGNTTGEIYCNCRDSNGNIKNFYLNKSDAERIQSFMAKAKNMRLSIYACPTSNVWHLTSGS